MCDRMIIKNCWSRNRSQEITTMMTQLMYSSLLVLLLASVNLPCVFTHISSVIESDGIPGSPIKIISRGPTVAPVPSPETIRRFEEASREYGPRDDTFFNPGQTLRNLLSFSSQNRLGMKRVSKFHGNGDFSLGGSPTDIYNRQPYQISWNDDDDTRIQRTLDDEEKPTFVPFIGARALTNIPEFFAHLKENLEALPRVDDSEELDDTEESSDGENEPGEGGMKDNSKVASRRMKAELLVDENLGHTTGTNGNPLEMGSGHHKWKPHAAGQIHYYSPKASFLDSSQNILRRANNYNPAWLYTNLGLGRRR